MIDNNQESLFDNNLLEIYEVFIILIFRTLIDSSKHLHDTEIK